MIRLALICFDILHNKPIVLLYVRKSHKLYNTTIIKKNGYVVIWIFKIWRFLCNMSTQDTQDINILKEFFKQIYFVISSHPCYKVIFHDTTHASISSRDW